MFKDREAAEIGVDFSSVADVEVSDNVVLRKLFPDKQPIHQGELEKLVDADVLDIASQQQQLQQEGQAEKTEDQAAEVNNEDQPEAKNSKQD